MKRDFHSKFAETGSSALPRVSRMHGGTRSQPSTVRAYVTHHQQTIDTQHRVDRRTARRIVPYALSGAAIGQHVVPYAIPRYQRKVQCHVCNPTKSLVPWCNAMNYSDDMRPRAPMRCALALSCIAARLAAITMTMGSAMPQLGTASNAGGTSQSFERDRSADPTGSGKRDNGNASAWNSPP